MGFRAQFQPPNSVAQNFGKTASCGSSRALPYATSKKPIAWDAIIDHDPCASVCPKTLCNLSTCVCNGRDLRAIDDEHRFAIKWHAISAFMTVSLGMWPVEKYFSTSSGKFSISLGSHMLEN